MNNQNQDDTIELLNECDAGVRMAVEAINEILPAVKDPAMQKEVQHCLEQHRKTGEQTAVQLHQHNCEGKSPSPIARGMSWLRTNVKLSMDDSDAAAADLLTDGCNMGVKTLTQFKNQYSAADSAAQKLADDIIHSEQQLADGLKSYLSFKTESVPMGIDSAFYGVYHSPDVLFNRNPIQPPIFRGGNADSLFEYS